MTIDAATPLAVSAFAGAASLPLRAGLQGGMFRARGIDLTLGAPSGSIEQMQGLVGGRTPIVVTAFDNVVAYRRGQGAPQIGAVTDIVAVAGIDDGMLTLVATPDIAGMAELSGRTLAVDAPGTGFSFALKGVLERAGIDPAGNPLLAVGNSAQRWTALRDGRASAAVLTLPADAVAVDFGFKALAAVTDVLGAYLGNVVVTRRGWAEAHRGLLSAFLGAHRRALAWTTAPANRQAAIGLLRQEMPELTPGLAVPVYERLVDPGRGLFRSMAIDPAGLRTVLDLRARFGPPSSESAEGRTYIDPSFLADAAT